MENKKENIIHKEVHKMSKDKFKDNKHQKYKSQYGKNELYWGIGIENEMYLQCSYKATVSSAFLKKNHKPERYSIDYYKSYKEVETVLLKF